MTITRRTVGWSAERLLHTWGLRVIGGSLTKPFGIRTGGNPGYDEDWEAACYVARVEGYARAYPVLIHVHAHFEPIETFRIAGPGETLHHALLSRGWGDLLGTPRHLIARAIYGEFRLKLSALSHDPARWFVPLPPLPEEVF